MTRTRTWWIALWCSAAFVLAALGWMTVSALSVERKEYRSQAMQQREADVRLALWRMDSWFGARLASEAARPYFEYQSYYAQQRAYTQLLDPIMAGEVLTPSPLLVYRDELIVLYVQRAANGQWTSPQVPDDSMFDNAINNDGADPRQIATCNVLLNDVSSELASLDLDSSSMQQLLVQAQLALDDMPQQDATPPPQQMAADPDYQAQRNWQERGKRGQAQQMVQEDISSKQMYNLNSVPFDFERDEAQVIKVGAFQPYWLHRHAADDDPVLVYLRTVQTGAMSIQQGFLVDWPTLHAMLLDEVADLLPDAALQPLAAAHPPDEVAARTLATVPAALEPNLAIVLPPIGFTALRATLGITWLAALLSLTAVGFALRSSIAYGQRRSRFASAVTHELRTPLTTFRLYSEMLADGMVTDDDQRAKYLSTLKDESGRLAALVENVLAYARLEEGRATLHRHRMTVGDLLAHHHDTLQRRVDDAKFDLRTDLNGAADVEVLTDREAVGQILLNLVDNACKYARDADDKRIDLRIEREGSAAAFRVRDHGPGVPGDQRELVFLPFRRIVDAGDARPGVGLGLALSRGLARDLGGDLRLVDPPDGNGGACFVLTVPQV
jgi:signal transduction histidine kinase